jgi:hypothetical protein
LRATIRGLVAGCRWETRGPGGLKRLAHCAASLEAHARDGWPLLTWPWPVRFPWLLFVLLTQRPDEAAWPPVGKRPLAPVSSPIVWAQIVPMPSPVQRCSEAGVGFRAVVTAFASVLIWWLRQSRSARLLVTASPWLASGSPPARAALGHSCIRFALKRAPVLRARRLGTLSTWAVCGRTKGARVRQTSRTARAAWGERDPAGHTPSRHPWANPRASAWASVDCRPLYCCIAAGLARCTR